MLCELAHGASSHFLFYCLQISELTGIVTSAAAAGAASLEGVRALLRLALPAGSSAGARTVLQAGAACESFTFQPQAVAKHLVAVISLVLSSGQVLQFGVPPADSAEPLRLVAESTLAALSQKQSDVPLVRLLDARIADNPDSGSAAHSSQSAVTKSSSTAAPAS